MYKITIIKIQVSKGKLVWEITIRSNKRSKDNGTIARGRPQICIIGVAEEEEREKALESISMFQEMAENFPNLGQVPKPRYVKCRSLHSI